MAPDQLRALLRSQPFRPFRVYAAGGESFDVTGPEWMLVTTATTAVAAPGKAGAGELVALLDTAGITHTEPLPDAVAG